MLPKPELPPDVQRPLYWTGNAAKARIIDRILLDPRPRITVFDYGAGRGGDWPKVLAARPGLGLDCDEPDPAATSVLRQALNGFSARVLTAPEFEVSKVQADYIVSFSVFEHVLDRKAYLTHVKRLLAPDGIFFLNYDDGHFRTALDLDELRGWRTNLAVTLQNRLAPWWPRLDRIERYQARVHRRVIDSFVRHVGFAVVEEHYENLLALKNLSKTIPADQQQAFTHFWLEVERTLNERFRTEAEERMGDTVNLWREMGARTLTLQHA